MSQLTATHTNPAQQARVIMAGLCTEIEEVQRQGDLHIALHPACLKARSLAYQTPRQTRLHTGQEAGEGSRPKRYFPFADGPRDCLGQVLYICLTHTIMRRLGVCEYVKQSLEKCPAGRILMGRKHEYVCHVDCQAVQMLYRLFFPFHNSLCIEQGAPDTIVLMLKRCLCRT